MATVILYQTGNHWVCAEAFGRNVGYAVYRNQGSASQRCARIGYAGVEGLRRAIAEADRRQAGI